MKATIRLGVYFHSILSKSRFKVNIKNTKVLLMNTHTDSFIVQEIIDVGIVQSDANKI